MANFNPRSLAGATAHLGEQAIENIISIHAPSRERHGAKYKIPRYYHFNPRSLAGATYLSIHCSGVNTSFQSTLPRGSDRRIERRCLLRGYFNPRSLAGATR